MHARLNWLLYKAHDKSNSRTKISQFRHNNLKVHPLKNIQYWIHMTTATGDGTHKKL